MSTAALRAAARRGPRELRGGREPDFAPVADVVLPHGDAANARSAGSTASTATTPRSSPTTSRRSSTDARRGRRDDREALPALAGPANTDDDADVTDAITTAHDPYLRPFARAVDDGSRS
jgi:hypothetical protein